MNKSYCVKIKRDYLKIDAKNAYKRPKIEKLGLGFERIMEANPCAGQEGQPEMVWAKGWAKPVDLSPDSSAAKWMASQIEAIRKKEIGATLKQGPDGEKSKWLSSLEESGYEFDADGKLVMNQAFLSGLHAQLCVMADEIEDDKGILFLNCGQMAFHDLDTVMDTDPETVRALLESGAAYKRRMPF